MSAAVRNTYLLLRSELGALNIWTPQNIYARYARYAKYGVVHANIA